MGDNTNNIKSVNPINNGFRSTYSTINNSFTKLMATNNNLANKSKLSSIGQEHFEDLNNLVETMNDIDNVGQAHIDNITREFPNNGLLQGTIYTSYESNTGSNTTIFQADINNSWKNKKGNFVIFGSANFGYEHEKVTGQEFNLDKLEKEIKDEVNENIKDLDDADKEAVSSAIEEASKDEDLSIPPSSSNKRGSISVNFKYDKGDFIYGGGASSTFNSDKSQMHEQNITVLNKTTKIAGDLIHRTVVSFNEDGEKVYKSTMNLKLNLVNRKENEIDKIQESATSDQIDDQQMTSPASEAKAEAETKSEELKKVADENGTGFNVDFEYDNTKCGFLGQYGIDVINNPDKKVRLIASPVLGAYRYSVPNEENDEALKAVYGAVLEFKKEWKDGQTLNADFCAAKEGIYEQGNKPDYTQYITFRGNYNNPRKRISANLTAIHIKTQETNFNSIETNVNYSTKNLDIGLQAGINKTVAFGEVNNNYQVGVRGSYYLPYKTSKK